MKSSHSMPFGAETLPDGKVRFRLWAPKAQRVDLSLEGGKERTFPLTRLEGGWCELVTGEAGLGTGYRFQIDGEMKVPDPASRFQPADVHGPSEIVDPRTFDWTDDNWLGRPWEEAVIYELHVGAFTPGGTFRAVEEKLDYLRDLGITAVELMPVADFPGGRNWGYDGVLPYAPDSSYGRPEDLKHLIQSAHARGLMMFLDVVYNHFGPEGNYLNVYSPQFFTSLHRTPWGDAFNFDGPDSGVVRDFFIHNALYWLEEYHFDGLRLDAVHAIIDESSPDILTELAQVIRNTFRAQRRIHLILENDDNASHYLRRERNRVQLYDAQWNDDVHHCLHAVITGESDGYYADYLPHPALYLCRCLTEGFAYQGEYSEYRHSKRGEPSANLPPTAFISFLQNHDQVGNRAFGERILQIAQPQAIKAAMEILLLAPSPPMLFMGEEFGAATPFLFFCDFHGELASAVTTGRRNEFSRLAKFNSPSTREKIPDPNAQETFLHSKLDWPCMKLDKHTHWLDFYRHLLAIRKRGIVPRLQEVSVLRCKSSAAPARSLLIDWTLADGTVLQLCANLGDEWGANLQSGGDIIYSSTPEAAQAAEQGALPPWSVLWSLGK